MSQEFKKRSIETQQLIKAMGNLDHDPVFTFLELSEIAGVKNIQDKKRGFIATAIKALEADRGIIFESFRSVGYRRVDKDGEKVAVGSRHGEKSRRAARRGRKKLACVDVEKLSPDERTRMFVIDAALGVTEVCLSSRGRGVIQQKVIERNGGPLQIGDLSALFE